MLVQSQTGTIDLLPALPGAWPEGRISGIRARGGFELDIEWKSGALTDLTVRSIHGRPLTIKYKGQSLSMPTEAGKSYRFDAELKRIQG
jgi:alpha-L-fucosidase 2